jgi:hypothetical protein
VDWNRAIGKVLAIHGANDGGITTYYNTVQLVSAVNAVRPAYAYGAIIPVYGHDSSLWALGYTPSTRAPFTFAWDGITPTSKNINIYEFWMACRNANFLFSTEIPPTIPPTNDPLKAIAVISVVDKAVTLDSTTSTGPVASCDWYITTDAGIYVNNISAQGLNPASRTLTVMFDPGNYVAQLTLHSPDGSKSIDTRNFSVGSVVVPPTPAFPVVLTDGGFTYTLLANGTFTYI